MSEPRRATSPPGLGVEAVSPERGPGRGPEAPARPDGSPGLPSTPRWSTAATRTTPSGPGAARGRLPTGAAGADRGADVAATPTATRPRSRRSGRCSGSTAGARPEGIRQAAAVMRRHPRLPGVGRELLRPAAHRAGREATRCSSAPTSPAGCEAATSCSTPSARRPAATARRPRTAAAVSADGEVYVSGFECLGACDIAPMASIDERYFGPLEDGDAATAIEQLRSGGEVLPEKALERRRWRGGPEGEPDRASAGRRGRTSEPSRPGCCCGTPRSPACATIDGYKRLGGYSAMEKAYRELEPDEILNELEESGLRGRGGAGFSMGKKASFLPRGEMQKYLCCNADESEPGAFKDRELMQRNPHQLIEGIAIAALAADAGARLHLHPRRVRPAGATSSTQRSPRPTRPATWATNILGTRHDLELVVHRGAGAYICGEETALLDALEGKRGNPRLKPPFPAVEGLYGGPDPDQQRRDPLQRAAHRRQRRRVVQELRHRAVAGDQGRLDLGLRAAAGQLRGRAGDPDPRASIYGLAGGPRRGARSRPSTRVAPPPRC